MSTHIKVLFTDRYKAPVFTTIAASEIAFQYVREGKLEITLLKEHIIEVLCNPQDKVNAPLSIAIAKFIPDNLAIINHSFENTRIPEFYITPLAVLGKYFIVALREPLNDNTWERIDYARNVFRGLNHAEESILNSLLKVFYKERLVWVNALFRQLTSVGNACGIEIKRVSNNPE